MKSLRITSLAAVVVLVAAACADNPTGPAGLLSPNGIALNVGASAADYLVDLNGNAAKNLAARVADLGGTVAFQSDDAGFALVRGLTPDAAASLAKVAGVGAVYADAAVGLPDGGALGRVQALPPEPASVSDPTTAMRYVYQWNMQAIGADQAWANGDLGSADVTVAILDSGIDYDGYDMAGKVDLSRSISFIPSDDAYLAANYPGRNPIDDLNGHGSNVASQVSSNALIFAGVSSKTTLMGVKVLGMDGSGSLGAILSGLIWAADNGADVANMSLGFRGGIDKRHAGFYVGLMNKVFNYAWSHGMLVVVAAGNEAAHMDNEGRILRAVCENSNAVCVSATGPSSADNRFYGPFYDVDAFAPYSNYGKTEITVAAPGGYAAFVLSVCARHYTTSDGAHPCDAPPGYFVTIGYVGTSQATPHVSGLAALLVAKLGKDHPAQIRQAIIQGADDLGPVGNDDYYGRGRINVPASLGN